MDLIPKPDQLVSAAGNVAHSLLYGGVADLRPMPRTLIDDGELREVYHYRPDRDVAPTGDPVLLVTPLAAPSLCFDLRRGCSLVEHLVGLGRPTYLVEYGQVSFRNRSLGMEHWVDEVLPEAVRAVHDHSGGRPVHLVGWSLGGIFALLVAADRQDLPIASLTVVGSPVDVTKVPLVAPVRPLLNLTQGRGAITRAYRALGGVPTPLVNWAFTAASAQKVVTKPLAVLTHLDDTDYLAQMEAVTRFMNSMTAYPGRTFGQLYHRFVKGNALARGRMEIGDRTVDLADVDVPVLVFAGNTDGIAPLPAVRAVVPLLAGSPEVRFEVVPGGHLGMLTGRAARTTTWTAVDAWVAQWSAAATARKAVKKAPARKAAAKKTAARKTAAKKIAATKTATTKTATTKTAAKKAPAKKAPAKKASAATIGSNPSRRYGSGGSRALGQR
ncbi:alpha/beta hydrolase [Nocardioides sp. J2M5]|uniref:alpha/beta fold hydrolase n=1 Tax=Nocardioides palaemonis TaxID=2829810 RepID=UPI001BA51C09|nr:alpha/beta fold hydrolase [Nocardioides palaemonis]MBS2939442.1 alpha/beta hydrolase [Nocardioides palaemonis]